MKAFLIVSFVLICVVIGRLFIAFQNLQSFGNGQQIYLQAILSEEPEISNRGQSFSVKNDQNQRIFIQTNLSNRYHYGDKLAIEGRLQVIEIDEGRKIYKLFFPRITVLNSSSNPFLKASKWVRRESLALFSSTLPPISANLLLGMVFGANGDYPDEFFNNLQTTGVLHVIAASGMNVSFFTGAVMFSLGTFVKRRIAIFLSIFAVIFYSFLVGFEPAIVRASLMALVVFTASFFGKQTLALFGLFLAVCSMLLWQPFFVTDVGFQLSVVATLGILLIKNKLAVLSRLKYIGEDFTTTLAAQIATFPILLGTFQSVGILSVLVNVLVLWTIPILMLLGSLAVVLGILFAPLGKLILFLALPFLLFFEMVVSYFGSWKLNFTLEIFPWSLIVGYYLILAACILLLQKSQRRTMKQEARGIHNS